MSKEFITRKEVYRLFDRVYWAGDIQNIMSTTDADWYWCGVYGWNCDIYSVGYDKDGNRVAITTGYRPFGHSMTDRKIERKYNELAREVASKHYLWDDICRAIEPIKEQYLRELGVE